MTGARDGAMLVPVSGRARWQRFEAIKEDDSIAGR